MPDGPAPGRGRAIAVSLGLVLATLAVDLASAGAARGSLLLVLAVGVATWAGGRSLGLTAAVLGTIGTSLAGPSLSAPALFARALDLAVLSAVVSVVSFVSDHRRRRWSAELLVPVAPDERHLAQRIELELQRLRAGGGSLVLASIELDPRGDDGCELTRVLLDVVAHGARELDVVQGDAGQIWLLLPDTDGPGARLTLERHRDALLRAARDTGHELRVSIGAAVLRAPVRGTEAVLQAKDAQRMADTTGRDPIVVLERRG